VSLKIEAKNASGGEVETSVIKIIIEYLYLAKQLQIILVLAFNIKYWKLEFGIDDIQYPTSVSLCETGPNTVP
jgi:hypothetical protein